MFGAGWPVFRWERLPTRAQDRRVVAVDGSGSSDDSDCAPLVSPAVASVSVVDALERNLVATQWEVSASVDISSGDEYLVRPDVGRDVSGRVAQLFDGEMWDPRPVVLATPASLENGHGAPSEVPNQTPGRGLVVEVALGVVDASAVALPSSHLIPDVAESDVLVFDPLDSHEENELDALSQNDAGGQASSQGHTQVDQCRCPGGRGQVPMTEVCVAPALAMHHGRRAVLASPAMVHNAHHDTPAVAQGFSARSDPIPPTIPSSSGTVRRLVLISNSQDVRSTGPVMDLTMMDTESDTDSENSAPSPHSLHWIGGGPTPEPVVSEHDQDSIGVESDTESLPGSVALVEDEEEVEATATFAVH